MVNKRGNLRSTLGSMSDLSRAKRAQVTIFIIVAILIVASILVYFLYVKPNFVDKKVPRLKGFDGCVQDALEGEIGFLGAQAGYVNPELTYLYSDDEVPYLCYTNLYYKPCIVQQPFVKNHFQDNLKKLVREKVNKCYKDYSSDLKARGYDVSFGAIDFEIELVPNKIVLAIEAPTSISSDAGGQRLASFTTEIQTPIYDILMIATSILQYETKYGDSDVSTLMIYYPELLIEKVKRDGGTTVYIITDKLTQTKFQFASRSFVWPAGYGMDSGLVGDQ